MNRLFLYLHRKSREQKHRLFLRLLRPTPKMRILNVGASGTSIGLPEQLESFYEHREQIIGGGISLAERSGLPAKLPPRSRGRVRWMRIAVC